MLIALDPVALNIGPLAVRWFGLLALAGLGLAVWRSLLALQRADLPRNLALDALAWALPAGLVTARVVHVLGWWDYYLAHASELWQFQIDGLSLWGGLLGGGLIGLARLRSTADPRQGRRILDAVAPNLALGIAVGRLGAFLDGHGQGLPSALPWATQYANPLAATPDFGVARHPAQLYDALVAIGLWVLVSRLPRRWPPGSRLAAVLVVYSSARLVLGAVRLDPSFLFGLQLEQILALGGLGFGLAYGLRPVLFAARQAAGGTGAGSAQLGAGPVRLAERVPPRATLYMKPDCHLCEAALSDLHELKARYPHSVEVVDIGTDDNLVRLYWDRIPVLNVGGQEYAAPLAPAVLERALQRAAAAQDRTPARSSASAVAATAQQTTRVPNLAPPSRATRPDDADQTAAAATPTRPSQVQARPGLTESQFQEQ